MDLQAHILEWEGLIRTAWPEIPQLDASPTQLYTSVEALRESVVEQMRQGDRNDASGIKKPFVVLDLGRMEFDPDWGVRSRVYRFPTRVYYVADEGTTQAAIHAKLVTLLTTVLDADRAGTLTTFQSPEHLPLIDTGPESDVNRALVGDSAVRVSSGHIAWERGTIVTLD